MTRTLGTDLFALNGIPSDIEAMAAAFPFGWSQLTNGMTVNIMARLAWPVYSKHYGGYHFFNPIPDGNWLYQDWMVYAEECARLFVLVMGENYGGCAPMVDVETAISDSTLALLFPKQTIAQRRASGNALYLRMLKLFCDTVEALTGKLPVIYTGKYFWESIGGATATWAARLPLCVAVYPFDNYTDPAKYLAAISDIMTGASHLPPVGVPAPWLQATYVQFTGRAPATLIPGYATGKNWAKTVDMSIKVDAAPTPTPAGPVPLYPAYKVIPGWNPNVHEAANSTSKALGYILSSTIIFIDTLVVGGYSHFQPNNTFLNGGFIDTSKIIKV
jgi:hypothetical protein